MKKYVSTTLISSAALHFLQTRPTEPGHGKSGVMRKIRENPGSDTVLKVNPFFDLFSVFKEVQANEVDHPEDRSCA